MEDVNKEKFIERDVNKEEKKSIKEGTVVFTRRFGLGIVQKLTMSDTILKIKCLETNRIEPISVNDPYLKVIKDYDTELAIPRDLRSDSFLLERQRELASLKDVKSQKKELKRDIDLMDLAEKVVERLKKGEEVHIKDYL